MEFIKDDEIILVIAPPWGVDSPSLGLGYLASYLRFKDIKVRISDLNVKLYNRATKELKKLWDFEEKDKWSEPNLYEDIISKFEPHISVYIEEIISSSAKIIAFSVNQNNKLITRNLISRIKTIANDRHIIVGGWGCYTKRERVAAFSGIYDKIDIIINGEAEQALFEAVKIVENNNSFQKLDNVKEPTAEENVYIYIKKPVKNLDLLPYPTYSEFNLDEYKTDILRLLGSRGCTRKCNYCNDRIYMSPSRERSPLNIILEIETHLKNYGIFNFTFNDLLINGNPKKLEKFCELLLSKGYDINWMGNATPDPDMNISLLTKMKKSGCSTLLFGVESGSDAILEKMNKRFRTEDTKKVLHNTKRVGMTCWINIIIGFPGETEEDFKQTCDFISNNKNVIDRVFTLNTCNVVFNSELMKGKEKFGVILPDNPERIETDWYTSDGNNNALRKTRVNIFKNLLSELNIPLSQTNDWYK